MAQRGRKTNPCFKVHPVPFCSLVLFLETRGHVLKSICWLDSRLAENNDNHALPWVMCPGRITHLITNTLRRLALLLTHGQIVARSHAGLTSKAWPLCAFPMIMHRGTSHTCGYRTQAQTTLCSSYRALLMIGNEFADASLRLVWPVSTAKTKTPWSLIVRNSHGQGIN